MQHRGFSLQQPSAQQSAGAGLPLIRPMVTERFVKWKESHRPKFLESGDQSGLHPSDRLTVSQLISWSVDQLVGWSVCQLIKGRDGGGPGNGRGAWALEVFKTTYYWTSSPSNAVLSMLCGVSGYSIREVDHWFKHRRWFEREVIMR